MQEQLGLLSNAWWAIVANDYTVTILLMGSLIITVMKVIAIIHPSDKSNGILCLLQGWIYGFPGMTKEEKKLVEDKKEGAGQI